MINLGILIILKEFYFFKDDILESYIKWFYNFGVFVDILVFYLFIYIFFLDIFFFMRLI